MATEHQGPGDDAQALRYAEGELSATEASAFEAHLAECSRCEALLSAHAQLGGLLGATPSAPPALSATERETLLARLHAAAQPSLMRPRRGRPVAGRLLWAAALAAMLLAGLLAWQLVQPPAQRQLYAPAKGDGGR